MISRHDDDGILSLAHVFDGLHQCANLAVKIADVRQIGPTGADHFFFGQRRVTGLNPVHHAARERVLLIRFKRKLWQINLIVRVEVPEFGLRDIGIMRMNEAGDHAKRAVFACGLVTPAIN